MAMLRILSSVIVDEFIRVSAQEPLRGKRNVIN